VTISSDAAPDLAAICRAALGRSVVAAEPLGAGNNSRVFRVELDDQPDAGRRRVVLKFYRCDPGDPRDRLATEFRSLQFLWEHGVRSIPYPIAIADGGQCAVYQWLDGEPATAAAAGAADIDAAVQFLRVLKRLRGAPGAGALPAASEACFSLQDIVASVERRLRRLLDGADPTGDAQPMLAWLEGTLTPLVARIEGWCRSAASRAGIEFAAPVAAESRTLSPSDFGFHNAIRRTDGTLAFVDFEYFGWDDPAKTIADFLLHPGMALDDGSKRRFAASACRAFSDVPALPARVQMAYALFGLKWVLILLNDFLPERRGQASRGRRAAQLAKAQALAGRLSAEHARNPFLS